MRYDAKAFDAPYLLENKRGLWQRVPRRGYYVLAFSNGKEHHRRINGHPVPTVLYSGVFSSAA